MNKTRKLTVPIDVLTWKRQNCLGFCPQKQNKTVGLLHTDLPRSRGYGVPSWIKELGLAKVGKSDLCRGADVGLQISRRETLWQTFSTYTISQSPEDGFAISLNLTAGGRHCVSSMVRWLWGL